MTKPKFIPKKEDIDFLVEPQIRRSCGPLFFSTSLESALGNIKANGSFGLVDTGTKKLLVTCNHVWREFHNLKKAHVDLNLCACLDMKNPVVLNFNKPISQNERLDLAVFDMEAFLPACIGRVFYRLKYLDFPKIRVGSPIAFVGYPGMYRSEQECGITFGRTAHAAFVGDVNESTGVADVSRMMDSNRKFNRRPGQENPYGGISGCPCYLIRKSYQAELAGFVTEEGMDLLRFTLANCINPDGTINC